MRISLTDWSYENIRGGLSGIKIQLGQPPARWTLVQMPNGTGKTTTMKLLRAIFTNEPLSPEDINSFRASTEDQSGQFILGLELDNVPYRLRMELDYLKGTVSYFTTRPATQGGGEEPGLVFPPELKMLLTKRFASLFIFDGELAKGIRDQGGREADEAIRTLYRLNELSTLRNRVSQVLSQEQDAAKHVTSATSKQGVALLLTYRDNAKSLRDKHSSDLKQSRKELTAKKGKLEEINKTVELFIQKNGDIEQENDALKIQIIDADNALYTAVSNCMNDYRSPAKLSEKLKNRMTGLATNFTTLQLPKTTSRDFFNELSNEDLCVCGRKIGDHEKGEIVRRADSYLAEDQISIIVGMKRALNELDPIAPSFPSAVSAVQHASKARKSLERDHDVLLKKIEDSGDASVADLNQRIANLRSEIATIEARVKHINTTDPQEQRSWGCSQKSNLNLAKREYEAKKVAYEKATKTEQFTAQAERLESDLAQIEQTALRSLSESVRQQTNEKLKSLVLMHELEVSRIDGAISLSSDRFDSHEGVSEGQSLSVAYAFLTSLLSSAAYDLPFIVDSPAVSLDLDVRREVVKIIPDLFDQMIMFVLSSEQAGFSEGFFDRDNTQFIDLSLKADQSIELSYGDQAFRRAALPSEVS